MSGMLNGDCCEIHPRTMILTPSFSKCALKKKACPKVSAAWIRFQVLFGGPVSIGALMLEVGVRGNPEKSHRNLGVQAWSGTHRPPGPHGIVHHAGACMVAPSLLVAETPAESVII